jgi:2-oxoglutarate dehydrogenase E2 component (dihydrolipoamide succinyltransferase)
VPSTAAGIIQEILFNVNEVVPIGTVIARIQTSATQPVSNIPSPPPTSQQAPSPASTQPAIQQSSINNQITTHKPITIGANRFYSPLVLNIAANEGISMSELEKIPGSGGEGRVTKKDILHYLAVRTQPAVSAPQELSIPLARIQPSTPILSTPSSVTSGNVEIIEMDRMRKLIADHMVKSKQTSPHVTSFTEADVTNLVLWREKVKKDFEKREGTKITYTPLFIEAIVRCIKKFPLINSSLDGGNIILKKDINIGMATALPSGNLIVPVIRNADQYNMVGLAKQVNQLADAARQGKLRPDDTQNGTFTLTNVGTFGSLMGTPIINQPQVAILAVGAIKKRPVVVETPAGDSIAIRHMMYLSMSYDHRIVDGSLGATFLTAVAKELESFDAERQL